MRLKGHGHRCGGFERHGDVAARWGAGDTVIAVMASMLAAGLSIQQAVHIANRAGGIVVGKLGTASVSYAELFGE